MRNSYMDSVDAARQSAMQCVQAHRITLTLLRPRQNVQKVRYYMAHKAKDGNQTVAAQFSALLEVSTKPERNLPNDS